MHALPRLSAATICQVCFRFCEHGVVTITPSPLHPRRLYAALSLRCALKDTAPAEFGDGSEPASPKPFAMRLSERERSVPEGKQYYS